MQVIEKFISASDCENLLSDLRHYATNNAVPLVERKERKRSLRYKVINGDDIRASLPSVQAIYESLLPVAQGVTPEEIVPLRNRKVGVNVNITPPGGAYRWHYDRNAVTAVLYLNAVEGGEIEAYPNYRLPVGKTRASKLQAYADRVVQLPLFLTLFGRKQVVPPQPGLLVVMRGDRCLYSVCEVRGNQDRICIVMSFDTVDAEFPQEAGLDKYLYSADATAAKGDPNYAR